MNRKDGIICHIILVCIVAFFVVPTIPMIQRISAASTSDSMNSGIGQNSNSGNNGFNNIDTNQKLSTTGSTEASTNDTVANTLVLTAIPDKPSVSIGSAETIHVKAAMANGTGIPDVALKAVIIDYVTSHEKVLLGGKTDAKGMLDLTANIGTHAKPGQFLAQINGTKGDIQKSISTGFVVTDSGKGSSSSGSTDSKGKCSGSSCR